MSDAQRINPKDGAEMVVVPAGTFLMGTSSDDIAYLLRTYPEYEEFRDLFIDEGPQHLVYLDCYFVYRYPVTVRQYRQFLAEVGRTMPHNPKGEWIDDHPMVQVSWDDAMAYADWAGARLATEAEWEKAARGTDGRLWPWGNGWSGERCVYNAGNTDSVGSRPNGASCYGALDMIGNAWEWCMDKYDCDYYRSLPTASVVKNPIGPQESSLERLSISDTPPRASRIFRGGSWIDDHPVVLRCAMRNCKYPEYHDSCLGFRCVIGQA